MEVTEYTNCELSKHYIGAALQVTAQTNSALKRFDERQSLIASSQINIAEFYRENGSLKKLKIGVGAATKRILESILENGAEEAKRIIFEQRHEKVRNKRWPGAYKPRGSTDNDPSWDNAVRSNEQ